jgi:hypothetical protein
MYISFISIGTYSLLTYSFHKLEPALLLGAYSMTISDWSSVLYDIQEMGHRPFLFRRGALIVINIIFASCSIATFIYCNAASDIDEFTHSPLYIVMIIMQIVTELTLTTMMLSAGIRLLRRIKGVTGILHNVTSLSHASSASSSMKNSLLGQKISLLRRSAVGSSSDVIGARSEQGDLSHSFEAALNRLVLVMGTCCVCILVQVRSRHRITTSPDL